MKKLSFIISIGMLFSYEIVQAQFLDSLQLKIGTTATVATRSYQPLWLLAGRYGTIADVQADLSSHIRLTNKHVYHGNSPLYDYLRKNNELPNMSLAYGLDLYNHHHFGKMFIQEAYVKFSYNHWQLRAGRYEEILGEINPELSSGSLGVSGNAIPIPKVSLAITDYTDIPLTNGWLQFKGLFSHGWMGKDRTVEQSLLHERNLYLRVGKEAFHLYGGLNRFAIWGGKHPEYGQLDKSWNGYRNIVLGGPIDDLRPYTEAEADRLGNHLGFIDLGFSLNFQEIALTVYQQTPFEDRSGMKLFGNPDQLLGVSVINHAEEAIFSALTLEYMDTRYQSGMTQSGLDNYYNNRLYKNGWTYLGRVIGTPLFVDQDRAALYLQEDIVGAEEWQVVNNRIRGMHLGWKGRLLPSLHFRTLATYTENYGNYFNNDQFTPYKRQWYFLQELIFLHKAWTFTTALGVDAGELTNNQGLSVGIEYHLNDFSPSRFKRQQPKGIR
ncbi:capsule assembly Wzi family protein [Catalinimonas niigatensis]|uniref:capsule assembly Wzi family protein n=1 Tax=Catalinimonas niigatensis TaxID=1397264 RepID=UPI0026662A7F|nr:capsule assembly Wzi family protein [Catalinimonas niigatensis]WPP52916.1 capsule assembly Wzi family protein [Catalinimonas niigatensis]